VLPLLRTADSAVHRLRDYPAWEPGSLKTAWRDHGS
jgi:hypothetical protein